MKMNAKDEKKNTHNDIDGRKYLTNENSIDNADVIDL